MAAAAEDLCTVAAGLSDPNRSPSRSERKSHLGCLIYGAEPLGERRSRQRSTMLGNCVKFIQEDLPGAEEGSGPCWQQKSANLTFDL